MDYLITMEDGSSVCLSHHGVKGMKWGVWNAETAARHRGGRGLSKTSKTEVLMKQKDRRYQAMKTGYADGKRLRKKNNIKTGPKNIAKDTDEIDSVYKQALYEYKFNKGSNAVGVKEYGEGLLSGLIGAKDPSNEYKKLRTGAYGGGSSRKIQRLTGKMLKPEAKYTHLQDVTRHQMNAGRMAVHESMRMSSQAAQQAAQEAAQEAARAGSLALTGGMNPFLFG